MARDPWAYRDVAVESIEDPRTGRLRIKPMAGQAYATSMRVQCARALMVSLRYTRPGMIIRRGGF